MSTTPDVWACGESAPVGVLLCEDEVMAKIIGHSGQFPPNSLQYLTGMKLSVHIPTYRRPEAINNCLQAISTQCLDSVEEILVAVDDANNALKSSSIDIPESIAKITRILPFPKVGLITLRQEMLAQAKSDIVLWLNDDAYPEQGFFEHHIETHQQHNDCVVGGRSLWKPIQSPNLFDRLVQQTDLLFFEPPATTTPTRINYRNCFGLNMSFPRELAIELGGIPSIPNTYGYDDIELAYRFEQTSIPIFHQPLAIVTHDHRYTPTDVLRREYLLGRSAFSFARQNPDFAQALFKRDITSPLELNYAQEYLARQYQDARKIEKSFVSLEKLPYDTISSANLHLLTEHWILLKRYLWNWGLLDAANQQASRWQPLQGTSAKAIGSHAINASR